MKKTIILGLAVAFSAAAMAITIPEKILSVKLSSATQTDDPVSYFQDPVNANDNEYQPNIEASKKIETTGQGNPNAIYVYTNTNYAAPNDKVSVLYVTNIYNRNIAIRTNSIETEYKFTFPSVNITDVASLGEILIIDTQLDSIFKPSATSGEGVVSEYVFTAPINSVIENRFFIYGPRTPDVDDFKACAYFDFIEIMSNPYPNETKIEIWNDKGELVKSVIPMNTPQVIDLSDAQYTSGRYILKIAEEEYCFYLKPVNEK